MGRLIRAKDWSDTAVGPIESWPQSLRTALSICLGSRFPMFVWWGRELTVFYNDIYAPILGALKHPSFLGRPAREQWEEVWDTLEPLVKQVMQEERATWFEDFLLYPVTRRGFPEETYFTFSYSPVRDESGAVGGMYCVCQETTKHVLGTRRLRSLREFGQRTLHVRSAEEATEICATVLSGNAADVPFALIYLVQAGDEPRLVLTARTGAVLEGQEAPRRLVLSDDSTPLSRNAVRTLQERQPLVLDTPSDTLGAFARGLGPEPLRHAVLLPIASSEQDKAAAGVMILGVNPRLPFDEDYRGYFDLLAGQLGTAIAAARAYEEERKRTEALAELDRAKTAFFSNVSHEFRTPLTLMLGPLEELAASARIPEPERQRLEGVHRNSQRLLKLVNALLDFSRLEAGRTRATYEPTDLAQVTAGLVSAFDSVMASAGLRLSVRCPPLPEPVWVDRDLWEKVVLNLVSNAFKFTLSGGISVELRWLGERVELSVQDTGTGIPERELPHIFDRFHRVEGTRGRSFEGSGIGLALVQELVRLHGGSVHVASLLGQGSTFTVSLPTGTAHLPRAQLREAEPRGATVTRPEIFVHEAKQWLAAPDDGARMPVAARVEASGAVPRGHVLLADDNADMRDYMKRVLEGRFTVEGVADGHAALEAIRARPPDLVLSDVMMPGLDGFGLLRELRADPRTTALPVILLSARAGEEATVEGLAAGANDYLVKPFSARELLARVEGAVRLQSERSERERVLRERADFEQQLIGIVSHDLRNPLSAITMSAAILLRRQDLDERQSRPLGRILSSAERANRMIRDLLDFTQSRLGSGLPIRPEPMDLNLVVRQVVDEVQVSQPERVLTLEQRGTGQGAWDADRLAQMLGNLLSNALSYSPAGTPVVVRTSEEADEVVLEVNNQGTPIPLDVLPRIFQPMQRGVKSQDTSSRSVGLGLYIVDQIVRAHRGHIGVTSTEAAGTTFTVRLPRQPLERP